VYVTKCQAVEVVPRQHTECTNEIPVTFNDTEAFVDPISLVIKTVMFIVGMARMLIDILVRAIIIARVRGWGFWMFGALWDTAFQVAVSPFRRAVEKGKEGAGRIRNQMEARAAYVPGQPQGNEPGNVEVLADWAASWRRRVYGMAPPIEARVGGANLPLDGGGTASSN
jgi:hypothetical protein